MKKFFTLFLMLMGIVVTTSATDMYLLGSGSFGEWSLSNHIKMEKSKTGIFYYEYTASKDEDINFCFSTSDTTSDWTAFNTNSYRPKTNPETIELGKNHSYETGGDANSFQLSVTEGEKYLIRISTIDDGHVIVMTTSEKVYIIGSLNTSSNWDPSSGIEMTGNDNYTYTYTIDAAGSNTEADYSFFSFTSKLGSSSSDWDGIVSYRFGATSDGDFVVTSAFYTGSELSLKYAGGASKAYQIPNGKYKLTVDLKKEILKINKLETVTTNGSGYSTYVNIEPLTIPAGTAYYATDNNNGSATAVAMTNPVAGVPMIIKGTPSTPLYFEVADAGTDDPSDNAFKAGPVTGLASNPSTGVYNYILNGDTFKAANGKNVGERKAYLQLSAAATGARVLIFDDEDVTAIEAVTTVNREKNAYYNIAGQRVAQPTKGLYIVNGKKVIIK